MNLELNMYILREMKDLFYVELLFSKKENENLYLNNRSIIKRNTIKKFEKMFH